MAKMKRNSEGLRDVLFDELEELRTGDGDPTKAMAVANLAKQIINTAKVELDFHRLAIAHAEKGMPLSLGKMALGTDAASASKSAQARSQERDGKEKLAS